MAKKNNDPKPPFFCNTCGKEIEIPADACSDQCAEEQLPGVLKSNFNL